MGKKATEVKKDLATRKESAVVAAGAFEQYAMGGFEEVRRENYALPFLTILQSLSPQVTEGKPEGARPGRIYNTVTQELYDSVEVIPCHYTNTIVEWVPRDKGGGFRGESPKEEREQEFNQLRDPSTGKAKLANGNELADTHNFYVMVVNPETGGTSPAIISMSSTQIKKAKNWLSFMRLTQEARKDGNGSYTPPMYARRFKLTTRQEQNSKGKWYGWVYESLGLLPGPEVPEFSAALEYHNIAAEGKVKVDRSQLETPGAETEETENL